MINIKASKEKSTTGYTNKLRLEVYSGYIIRWKKPNEKISIAKKDLKNFIQNESFYLQYSK